MGGESRAFWVWLCVLVTAFALFTVMSVTMTIRAHAAPVVIDIQDDPGGSVKQYYEKYQELSREGTVIRIHGYCASACTLILLREMTGIKACAVDDKALFAFHKPFAFDRKHKIIKSKAAIQASRQIWATMLASFPYDVYTLLKDARIPSASEGDAQDDMFVVPAIFFVPKCEVAQ